MCAECGGTCPDAHKADEKDPYSGFACDGTCDVVPVHIQRSMAKNKRSPLAAMPTEADPLDDVLLARAVGRLMGSPYHESHMRAAEMLRRHEAKAADPENNPSLLARLDAVEKQLSRIELRRFQRNQLAREVAELRAAGKDAILRVVPARPTKADEPVWYVGGKAMRLVNGEPEPTPPRVKAAAPTGPSEGEIKLAAIVEAEEREAAATRAKAAAFSAVQEEARLRTTPDRREDEITIGPRGNVIGAGVDPELERVQRAQAQRRAEQEAELARINDADEARLAEGRTIPIAGQRSG
jgi:hypothetical protein